MWISKNKYLEIIDRIQKLEGRHPVMVSLPTGRIEKKYLDWIGFVDQEVMHEMDVRDAIRHIIKAAGICIDYTPSQPEVKASVAIRKCDKKGK